MLTDLSVVAILGACALALVGLAMVWVGRTWEKGILPGAGKLALRTSAMRQSPADQLAGNRAAGPFLERYGRIIAVLCALVVLMSFINDITAIVLYILALVFLGLAALVCVRKGEAAAKAHRREATSRPVPVRGADEDLH